MDLEPSEAHTSGTSCVFYNARNPRGVATRYDVRLEKQGYLGLIKLKNLYNKGYRKETKRLY
jgi:hypothetical protein